MVERRRRRFERHLEKARGVGRPPTRATIKSRVTKKPLALSSRRDNHPPAATAKIAILIVAAFSSRLSRYMQPHRRRRVGVKLSCRRNYEYRRARERAPGASGAD
jgi:hypothetical protein